MSRRKSPNYPGRDLEGAIQDARKVYDQEGKSSFPGEALAKALGYGSFSGPARVRLAALKQYGLIDQKRGGEAKISERALTLILMNASHPEWKDAVRAAALAPSIFNELFHEKLSASDTSIKHTLVVGRNFTDDGAKNCIRVWRATMGFARLDENSEQGLKDTFKSDNVSGQEEVLSSTENEQENAELQVGDYVQWCSQGVDRFKIPPRITRFTPERDYAFVEGTATGIPTDQLEKCDPPEQHDTGQQIPSLGAPMEASQAGTQKMKQYPIPLGGGADAVLVVPQPMTGTMYGKLKKIIEMYEDVLTSEDEGPSEPSPESYV